MPRTLTASDRSALIRLASTMPVGSTERRAILAGLTRVAMEHATQEAMDKYLKAHPGADKSKHKVKKQEKGKANTPERAEEAKGAAKGLKDFMDLLGGEPSSFVGGSNKKQWDAAKKALESNDPDAIYDAFEKLKESEGGEPDGDDDAVAAEWRKIDQAMKKLKNK